MHPISITCPMRVLIAGCGYVGSALGLLLAAEGQPVFGLRRDASKLSSPITPVQVELSSPLPSDALPPNLDAIAFAATPSGSTDEAYRTAYMDGARNLISALESQKGLHRDVFVFSTEVYDKRGSEWVDEKLPTEPERFLRQAPARWRASRAQVLPREHPPSRRHLRPRPDHRNRARFPRITKGLSSLKSELCIGWGGMVICGRIWRRLGDQVWAKDERSPSPSSG